MNMPIWFYLFLLAIGYAIGATVISRRNNASEVVVTQTGTPNRSWVGLIIVVAVVVFVIYVITSTQ